MNIDIQIERPFRDRLQPDVVRKAAAGALAAASIPGLPALTVLVTGDSAIRELNREYMAIDAPTDVLSFPSGETPGEEEDERYLGDIMISLETAERQAAAGGHTLSQEVELLAVHGVLHLLGHDHADEDGKAAMWALQSAVLQKLGNPLAPP